MKLLPAGLLTIFLSLASNAEASPRDARSFEGRYEGHWIRPTLKDTNSGASEGYDGRVKITLKFPADSGRRNGAINGTEVFGTTQPFFTRLKTDFGEPEIRRNGKKAIYKATATWKQPEGSIFESATGPMIAKISKRGSHNVLKRGNLQLYGISGPNTKIFGKIKAKN